MEELLELKEKLASNRPDGWEKLPDIPLYMDQVVSYLTRQMVCFEEGDALTSAMINNYIKDGLLSRANGKKYGQEHLAYLTAISALKQVLSVREMRTLVAIGREQGTSEQQYDYFCRSPRWRTCRGWCSPTPCKATPTGWPAAGCWRSWLRSRTAPICFWAVKRSKPS